MTGSPLPSVFPGDLPAGPQCEGAKDGGSPLTSAPSRPRVLAPREAGAERGPAAHAHRAGTIACSRAVGSQCNLPAAPQGGRTSASGHLLPTPSSGAPDPGCCSSTPRRQGAGGGRGRSSGVSLPTAQPILVIISGHAHPGRHLTAPTRPLVSNCHPETPPTVKTLPHPEDTPLPHLFTLLPRTPFTPMTRPLPPSAPQTLFSLLRFRFPATRTSSYSDNKPASQDTLSGEVSLICRHSHPKKGMSLSRTPPPERYAPPQLRRRVVSPPLRSQNPPSWLPILSGRVSQPSNYDSCAW